jgi:hypothetical protein
MNALAWDICPTVLDRRDIHPPTHSAGLPCKTSSATTLWQPHTPLMHRTTPCSDTAAHAAYAANEDDVDILGDDSSPNTGNTAGVRSIGSGTADTRPTPDSCGTATERQSAGTGNTATDRTPSSASTIGHGTAAAPLTPDSGGFTTERQDATASGAAETDRALATGITDSPYADGTASTIGHGLAATLLAPDSVGSATDRHDSTANGTAETDGAFATGIADSPRADGTADNSAAATGTTVSLCADGTADSETNTQAQRALLPRKKSSVIPSPTVDDNYIDLTDDDCASPTSAVAAGLRRVAISGAEPARLPRRRPPPQVAQANAHASR